MERQREKAGGGGGGGDKYVTSLSYIRSWQILV